MSFFSKSVTAKWYNPTNGNYTTIGTFENIGSQAFTTPGNNSTGTNDWILTLEVISSPIDITPPAPPSNSSVQ